MGRKLKIDKESAVKELRPWIRGFIQKEYSFLCKDDQEDLEQEGALHLIQIVGKLEGQTRFKNKEEYLFYVKATVRNGVRDYALKEESRFGISLYKLRRHRKESGQGVGDFMTGVGEAYVRTKDEMESIEDRLDSEIQSRRLSLLSQARKGGRELTLVECRALLFKIIQEYKSHHRDLD